MGTIIRKCIAITALIIPITLQSTCWETPEAWNPKTNPSVDSNPCDDLKKHGIVGHWKTEENMGLCICTSGQPYLTESCGSGSEKTLLIELAELEDPKIHRFRLHLNPVTSGSDIEKPIVYHITRVPGELLLETYGNVQHFKSGIAQPSERKPANMQGRKIPSEIRGIWTKKDRTGFGFPDLNFTLCNETLVTNSGAELILLWERPEESAILLGFGSPDGTTKIYFRLNEDTDQLYYFDVVHNKEETMEYSPCK